MSSSFFMQSIFLFYVWPHQLSALFFRGGGGGRERDVVYEKPQRMENLEVS